MPAGARLNRALCAFRAIFALLALVLLAVIVRPQAFQGTAAPSPPVIATGHGRTTQGAAVAMRFEPPGRPVWFRTRIDARCTNPARPGAGWPWRWGWWPTDGRDVRFRRDGRLLRVASVGERTFDDGVFGQLTLAMRATVAPDGERVRGWVRLSATFFYAIGPTTCDSGRVPFAVGATSGRPS